MVHGSDDLENIENVQSPPIQDPGTTEDVTLRDADHTIDTPASVTAIEPNNVSPIWFENRPTQRRRWRECPLICSIPVY